MAKIIFALLTPKIKLNRDRTYQLHASILIINC